MSEQGKKEFSVSRSDQNWPDWIKIGISAIPYIGSPLSTYLGDKRQKKVQERVEAYFSYISDELNRIDNIKLNKEYLNSDEFGELFARGAEEAARSTTNEKIRRFANIILNGALNSQEYRQRSMGMFTILNRLSDLDTFILLAFGPPYQESFNADSSTEALKLIKSLANFLKIEVPSNYILVESLIYMDNIGVTWVSQHEVPKSKSSDAYTVNEFSVFRPPLGNAVAIAISPPDFFVSQQNLPQNPKWPEDYISLRYSTGTDPM